MTEIVLLEDRDGRLVTYATVPAGRLPSIALIWRDRTFKPFGEYRPEHRDPISIYRERVDDDGNNPITCLQVNDPITPRTRP